MGETGFTCLKDFAKLQRNRLTTTQGRRTAHTSCLECMYIYIYISLVSYIFDCGQCRALGPGMVIWISPTRMGKLVGMPFNNGAGDFSRPNGDFSGPKGDFTRPKLFWCMIYHWGRNIFQLSPSKANSSMIMPEQTLAIATSRCVIGEDRNMK